MNELPIIWKPAIRKVSELKHWDKNPRKISGNAFEKLKERIKARGFHGVLKIDTDDVVLSGNMGKEALMALGIEQVNVLFPSRILTAEERDKVALESNIHDGEWDFDLLANSFEIPQLLDVGFSSIDLGLKDDGREDDFDIDAALTESPTSKRGDIFQLGVHRIMCGDATVASDVDALMGDKKSVDMVFTDPPYNVDYKGGMQTSGPKTERRKIMNDKMSSDHFYKFLSDAVGNMIRYTHGAFYICMSSSELHNLWLAFTSGGGHWQEYIIWAKDHFTLSRTDYHQQFEPIMYGLSEDAAKETEDKYEQSEGTAIMYGWTKHRWYGGRKQGNVWFFDRPKQSKLHPTMKPIQLVAKAIKNSTGLGDTILDLFLGAGSTIIASEKTGRICYGMEMDPLYVDVCVRRFMQYNPQAQVVCLTRQVKMEVFKT